MAPNIWVAAADGQQKAVEAYIDSGLFGPNSKDPNGYTPMHAAASYGHRELLQLLVTRGGNINIQDAEGDTPLHHVEDVETAHFLVETLKADTTITNNDGLNAENYIDQEADFPEVAAYLRNKSGTSTDTHGIDDSSIRYTMETEPDALLPQEQEQRRKQIEAILQSNDPDAGLRELVTQAVHEGMNSYANRDGAVQEPAAKRQR